MQRALSTALSLQHESTGPLLQAILAPTATQHVIQVAGNALRQTGAGCIPAICDAFLNMQVLADATEAGLKCLIEMLGEWKRDGRIPARAEGGAVRALVALFKWLIEDVNLHAYLVVTMIPVMAGFRDQRIVTALLKLLGRPGILLEKIYEEVINGLSQLGAYAVDHLLEALNSPKETVLTQRVRQVLLEIEPFPREKLLSAFADTRTAVVQQVMLVFIAKQQEVETVRFLVKSLLDNSDDHPLFDHIQRTLNEMHPACTMPYLVEVLGQLHWQVIKPLLRACPQPGIVLPLLVTDPVDVQRYVLVLEVLRDEFHFPTVLPWLIPGLANDQTREHTRRLIATMARTYDGDLLPDIVRLFNPAIAQPEPLPGPLPGVHRTLQEMLTTELAADSLPALVLGLAEPPLRESCTGALVTLAHVQQRQGEVIQAVLQALRNPAQRLGAHHTLVRCGDPAAQSVCHLVGGNDQDLTREACAILAEMGVTAFPYIYQLAHVPQHHTYAEDIFHLLPAETIAKGLLAHFASNDRQKEAMAFYLLAMGMHDEQGVRLGSSSLTSALLAHTLEQANSDVRLRTLSALLFFSNGRRAEMAQQAVKAITRTSEAHFSTEYLRALLLLGKDAADPLGLAIHAPDVPENVRLEMIGALGTLAEDEQITAYVRILAAGTDGTASLHRARGLRALGGLLAGGVYHEKKLEAIREELSARSKAQDRAACEFFDMLLGKHGSLEASRLRDVVNKQQHDIDRLSGRIRQQEEELAQARQRA